MQNPGTEVTVQAIIISFPAVWFSRHTHTQKNPFCIPSFPSTIKFTFYSVLTYMRRLLTVATLIPAGVDLGQQRVVQFVKVVSGWQIWIIAGEAVRYSIDLLCSCAGRGTSPTSTLISQINQLHPRWSHQCSSKVSAAVEEQRGAVIFCPATGGFWPAVLQHNNCMDEKRNMGFRGKHGSSLLCVKTKA